MDCKGKASRTADAFSFEGEIVTLSQSLESWTLERLGMKPIRKYLKVDSDTIRIDELRRLKGRNVEVTVRELPEESLETKKKRLSRFFELAGKIDIDESAFERLREASKL